MADRLRSAREVARVALARVRRDAAYANLALGALLERAQRLSARDRALATELVYGVLRWQSRLDHILASQVARPLSQVDPDVLDVLRLGAYQLLFLDRIPPHAAVSEAVTMTRQLRGARVAGFVNAVLRKLSQAGLAQLPLPQDPLERFALEGALPRELAQRLVQQFGMAQAKLFAQSMLERAPLTVRVNRLRTDATALKQRLLAEGAQQIVAGRWVKDALDLVGLDQPFVQASYLEGCWSVQDEAAQLVVDSVDPQPGEAILDLCAGIGGKATAMAERMLQQSTDGAAGLVCCDLSARKLELLQEHAHRLGLARMRCFCGDGSDAAWGPQGPFARVLVDAPCSGLGVLRRHPELKWRWNETSLAGLVETQRALLRSAYQRLAVGGVLVYAVCTITNEEGPQQVDWLLKQCPGLVLEQLPQQLAAVSTEGTADDVGLGQLRLWPQLHHTDGFFVARLRRRA